jgi:hypothetical protein
MVFWENYPLKLFLKSKFNNLPFRCLKFDRISIESPNGTKSRILDSNDSKKIKEIKEFLKLYFGNPPNTPILDIPENKLVTINDIIIYLEDNDTKEILGCIRYHYLGIFINTDKEIYCVDCFCIHPRWRKKGLGDFLLTELHIRVNLENKPYSVFLKEGRNLSIFNQAFYSGQYVFKKINNNLSIHVSDLYTNEAYSMIDIFYKFNKKLFIIKNPNSSNQIWKLYKKDSHIILACIQNTYQIFKKDNKNNRIGWITAWIESSEVTDIYREEASREITDSIYGIFDYIWANREWVGNSKDWSLDGGFHWYLYQWASNISIKKSYCLLN